MRTINVNQILPKKYSIENEKVISKENGEYFSLEIAKMIILSQKHNDFKNVEKLKSKDQKEQEKAVKNYCEEQTKNISVSHFPSLVEKEYEIFKLNIVTNNYYLFYKKDLPKENSLDKIERFFLFENAKLALEIFKDQAENETINLEENDNKSFEEKIQTVREYDETEYLKSLKLYGELSKTEFYKNYTSLESEMDLLKKENNSLKFEVSKLKLKVKELQDKLRKALVEIEKERNNEENKKILGIFGKKKK